MSPASTPQGWVIGRIGAAPVVVSPTSLLLGLLIAGSWYPLVSSALGAFGPTTVLLVVVSTVLGVAASVLLHELAHGLSGTLMGRRPTRYELYLWGGRTSFGPAREWTAWKDLVTSLSGPATNLLLWLIGTVVQDFVSLSVPVAFTIWAVTLVNLALAVFNALPGLPLDGGYALAALVVQVTGNRRLGLKAAGWGGLIVVGGVMWWWILRPLVLYGRQPGAFNLILVVMVGWSIVASSWQVLELGGGARAAPGHDPDEGEDAERLERGEHEIGGHESTEAPTVDTQTIGIDIGQRSEFFHTLHLVFHLNLTEMAVGAAFEVETTITRTAVVEDEEDVTAIGHVVFPRAGLIVE